MIDDASLRALALYCATAVRHSLEEVDFRPLSEAQIAAIHPVVGRAIYSALWAGQNADRSRAALALARFTGLPVREAAELPGFTDTLKRNLVRAGDEHLIRSALQPEGAIPELSREEIAELAARISEEPAPDLGIELRVESMRDVIIDLAFFNESDAVLMTISETPGEVHQHEIERAAGRAIRDRLSRVQAAAMPANVSGLEGVTYSLSLEAGFNRCEWTWWCDPPAGWEGVAQAASEIAALAEPFLRGPLIEGP